MIDHDKPRSTGISGNKKPSFRREPKPTGLYSVGHPYATTDIKLGRGGGKVGYIDPPSAEVLGGHQGWKILFMVKREPTGANPAPFCWMEFRNVFDTEDEARAAIRKEWVKINSSFDLYVQKD